MVPAHAVHAKKDVSCFRSVAIGDRIGTQAVPRVRSGEETAVVANHRPERLRLRLGERERARLLVVPVRAEVLDRPAPGRVRLRSTVGPLDQIRGPAQVVGGEVGAQVGPVAERRPVLHQAVVQEHLLTLGDVLSGVENPALPVDDALGHRRLLRVGAVGEQPEDEEPDQSDQDRGLDPALRDQQLSSLMLHRHSLRPELRHAEGETHRRRQAIRPGGTGPDDVSRGAERIELPRALEPQRGPQLGHDRRPRRGNAAARRDAAGRRAPGRARHRRRDRLPPHPGAVRERRGRGAFAVDDPFGQSAEAPAAGGPGIPASPGPRARPEELQLLCLQRTLNTWEPLFAQAGEPFTRAKVVLYRGAVATGCGDASSAVGPFYCPADQRVYLDLSFYGDMERQLGAPGDFAWAYVIAHEVGHHVQQQLGTSDEVNRLRSEQPDEANALSVRLELQADCYAGVWAHSVYAAGDLDEGDVQRGGAGLRRGGRRPAPAAGHRPREPRLVHARQLRAAHRVVQPRPCERRPGGLRHLLARQRLGRRRRGIDGGQIVHSGRDAGLAATRPSVQPPSAGDTRRAMSQENVNVVPELCTRHGTRGTWMPFRDLYDPDVVMRATERVGRSAGRGRPGGSHAGSGSTSAKPGTPTWWNRSAISSMPATELLVRSSGVEQARALR